ncbi:MAG: amidohydrolase family protein [Acidobacteria bacterium]|nr:amidohydrolase family protein [Acidobacteriota bacterium]
MQTPWGDISVCDAHIHFFSQRFFQLLAAQKPGLTFSQLETTLRWVMPPPDPKELANDWVRELDRAGVTAAALIASLPGDEESVAAAVAAHPSRFRGFFMANPSAPDAVLNASGHISSGRLHVPCLFPAMHQYSLHDPRVIELLAVCAGRPASTVFVHCGVLSVGVRGKLGLPSLFDMRYSNPIDLHALALRFPSIRFIVPHFGAGYFREALMLADLCPNVYLDTSSSNSWMRYEGLSLAQVFERALKAAGPQRLLFGTDSSFFPRGWNQAVFQAQCEAMQAAGVDAEAAAAILGGNFTRLFG